MNSEVPILIVEDDENDVFFLRKALQLEGISDQIRIVGDGEEAICYLEGRGDYLDRLRFPFPQVIYTDLKMPRKTGFDLLEWLRSRPECAVIPVMVLTTSQLDSDIRKAYQMGANAYIAKTAVFDDLRAMLRASHKFWAICEKPEVPAKC
jgi:CheY-like chemotaxis protein